MLLEEKITCSKNQLNSPELMKSRRPLSGKLKKRIVPKRDSHWMKNLKSLLQFQTDILITLIY